MNGFAKVFGHHNRIMVFFTLESHINTMVHEYAFSTMVYLKHYCIITFFCDTALEQYCKKHAEIEIDTIIVTWYYPDVFL